MEQERILEEGFVIEDETGKHIPDYEGTIKNFNDGDIVTGTVVRVDRDEVLVDIGYKSEGVIPARELSIRYGVSPDEVVKIGDTIDALVLQKEDKEGRLILSKKRAEYERVWQRLEAIKEIDGTIKGEVIEVVKGGLIVDIGLRGFVPASLVDTQRVRDLKVFMGQEFECHIVELNRNRNNVVLSRRAFMEGQKKEEKKKLLETLQKGQIVKGTVSSIVSFGAFIDIGGIDGLVHISELSWGHVGHPSEVLSVGDEVNVEVLSIEHDRNRVSLGLKQTQPDPWREVVKRFKTGEIIDGRVTKIVQFGAFVEVANNVEGLIHISEMAEERVEFPGDVVSVGQNVKVKVVDIDLDRHRLSLSLKQAQQELEPAEETEASTESSSVEAAEAPEPVVEEAGHGEESPVEESPAPEGGEEEKVEAGTAPEEHPAEETPAAAEEAAAEEAAVEEAPAEESAAEKALREAEEAERDIEPVNAEAIVESGKEAKAKAKEEKKEAEPASLEDFIDEMKRASKTDQPEEES